jgi:hypothetical protein
LDLVFATKKIPLIPVDNTKSKIKQKETLNLIQHSKLHLLTFQILSELQDIS